MATTININISGYGVKTTTESSDTRHLLEYSERQWQEDNFYTLLPGFSPVGYLHGERKLKKKKKKNCTNGQVCGFSCISKTKTCIANMTTAQLKEHNKAKRLAAAEKRKAAKAAKAGGAGGASQPNPEQKTKEVGWGVTNAQKVEVIGLKVNNANEERAQKIAKLYLEGEVPFRPVIVKRAGFDTEEFIETFDVVNRQDEARAHQIAKSQNNFYELAPTVIVTPKNEAFVNEQLELTAKVKREIPEASAAKSQPFNPKKDPTNPRALFDIDSVISKDPELSTQDQKLVESLAQNYLKGGNIDPIVVKRKGANKERADQDYEVVSGKLEFAALRRARQLDPEFELFSGIVMDSTNERNLVDQLKAIYE